MGEVSRVVVTGGRGFLGTHLVRALTSRGVPTVVLDLRDGLDVCDGPTVRAALRDGDCVVHLAAYANLYEARETPIDAVRVNVLGTATLADAVRQAGGRLIHGSTACVYGNQDRYPCSEDARPNPTEIYGHTKLAAEQVVRGMVASHGLDATIVRFPGLYGEGLRGALAVARFFRAAMRGADLVVHGDGHQTRSPLYAGDLVEALVRLVERPDLDGVANLPGSEEVSALNLARRIQTLVGAGRIVHGPQRLPQTWREALDGSRAEEWLDWRPTTSLDLGLRRTWEWFRGEELGER